MNFEFATANRIIFGPGRACEVGALAAALGSRVLLVTGRDAQRAGCVEPELAKHKLVVTPFAVSGEPTTEIVAQGAALARRAECDLVVAVGGGSVMDAGKAIAALATNRADILTYLEVIGQGQPLTQPALPIIALPTTAGTGAEVTRNAVLASPEHRVKVSMRSASMLPAIAIVDPELTRYLPPALTATTGMDALTQVIEPYVSGFATPLTDGLCREGLWRAASSLEQAFYDGEDPAAREDMALASLFGGMALANAKLGAVHGFAGPLGGLFNAPHGAICAVLLPAVMEMNVQALVARTPVSPHLRRYSEVAQILTGRREATPGDGITHLQALNAAFAIPGLSRYGVTPADFPRIVAAAKPSSSMKGNPIVLTDEELTWILEQAL
jgi:alcohol dehydrogenase class IV